MVYSCYCSPNCSMDEFLAFLDGLDVDIWRWSFMYLVVAGDFNQKSRWGARDDRRRAVLLEFMAGHGLWVGNIGSALTYPGPTSLSVIDVTLNRFGGHLRLGNWGALVGTYTDSDQYYLVYNVTEYNRSMNTTPRTVRDWVIRHMNKQKLEDLSLERRQKNQ